MSDDYRVKGRSDFECRQIAKKARAFFGVSESARVDILACLKSASIWTVSGEKRLNFQPRPDSELGNDDGITSYGKGVVTIAVKQSVHDRAIVGDGRSRHTHAHEIGHGVMHNGPPMSRRAGAVGIITPKWLPPFESAEHQAKIFAAAFLINDTVASTLSTAEEISIEFGISLESAKIYFKQLVESRNRDTSAANVRRMADEFRALATPPRPMVRYIDAPCAVCGNATVFPVGVKFMCQTCDNVSDRYQDGDSLGS